MIISQRGEAPRCRGQIAVSARTALQWTRVARRNKYSALSGTQEIDAQLEAPAIARALHRKFGTPTSAGRSARRLGGRRFALGVDFGDNVVDLLVSLGHHFASLLADLIGAANRRSEHRI